MTMGLGRAVSAVGAVRRGSRAGIVVVVEADCLDSIAEFLFLRCGFALGVNLGLSFAIGRASLFQDIDDVSAL